MLHVSQIVSVPYTTHSQKFPLSLTECQGTRRPKHTSWRHCDWSRLSTILTYSQTLTFSFNLMWNKARFPDTARWWKDIIKIKEFQVFFLTVLQNYCDFFLNFHVALKIVKKTFSTITLRNLFNISLNLAFEKWRQIFAFKYI